MSYGINSPFGLRAWGHLIGGASAIKENRRYVIGASSGRLNKGDPVSISTVSADYAVNMYNKGGSGEIVLYKPVPTPQVGGAAIPQTTVLTDPANQNIAGVFQGCEFEVNGVKIQQEYWVPGTAVTSAVTAIIIDDPYVIWDMQLSCYTGARFAALDQFALLPCMQIQNPTWPNTGVGGATNPVMANSAVIGSNLHILTGNNVAAAVGTNVSATMSGVVVNNVVMNYRDNPIIDNQNTAIGNPNGTSTFYACPSLAYTANDPLTTNGTHEYDRNAAPFRVLGFTPDPKNVPATYGVHPTDPTLPTAGTYFNTPFLNVIGLLDFYPQISSPILA
jgi:hypothetical protein